MRHPALTRIRALSIINHMIICHAENLSRHYGPDPVFENLAFQIQEGERIGLVGPNGAGKSTLLRVMAGVDPPDTGFFRVHPSARVAMLRQFPEFAPDQTLAGEARRAMAHLIQWHEDMLIAGQGMADAGDADERTRWGKRYDELAELLRRHGGYDFDHRIEDVLFGLGFEAADFDRRLATFSGGQQNRVLLGQLLLTAPDLMLLDEPTNHLDIDATEWLENYLRRQSASLVIVSHDRYFLERTTTKIFELSGGEISVYAGAYSAYVRQRAERAKVAERLADKQEAQIAHQRDFIRRNLSGQLAKQAKSREKVLARLEEDRIERVRDVSVPIMGFGDPSRSGDIVISASDLSKSFDRPLFENLSLQVERGQRLGIIGPNGCGKTTLLKILLGQETPTKGAARLGANVQVGYLDQQLATLDPRQTPVEAIKPQWRRAERDEPFRALLARFGIGADLVEQTLSTLSGGERTRVALARIAIHEVNLLVLDEPTNHLDLWAREALEKSLAEFEGTVIVVSHDRYFLNQAVDRLLWLGDGGPKVIPGNYDRFQEWRDQARLSKNMTTKEGSADKSKADKPKSAKRKRKFPYRKVDDLEREISEREAIVRELEESLHRPDIYKDGRKVDEIARSIERERQSLSQLMEHWEESMELNG